ncbi:cytochrome P450 [Striga asiatica]|uniref:Cytochrome P450 n=1 Tax=Striga asiatica TaxID=4170 RepID=A0A5A7P1V0_STRAF|nr:cytochrome P450 [Striga asiatica]
MVVHETIFFDGMLLKSSVASAFQEDTSLTGISSNSLRAETDWPHLTYMSINDVATYISEFSPSFKHSPCVDFPRSIKHRSAADLRTKGERPRMMALKRRVDGFEAEWKTAEADAMLPELAYMATILAERKASGRRPLRRNRAWSCCPCLRRLVPVRAWKTAA